MKPVVVLVAIATVMAFAVAPVGAVVPVTSGTEIPLYAGQDELVGHVTVSDDGTYLNVTYHTDSGWTMTETHLAVGDTLADLPTNKKGNPQVGHFAYSATHDPAVNTYTYLVPLSEVPNDGSLAIAAHAVVQTGGVVGDGATDPQWATSVVDSTQGALKNGDPVTDSQRTDPTRALGTPEGTNTAGTFYSLGFATDGDGNVIQGTNDYTGGATAPADGYLIVSFDHPVYNGPGDQDIVISEVTFGRSSYPDERADVYVWHDGAWVAAGFTVSNQDDVAGPGTGAVGIPDGIESTTMVMLVDATNPAIHSNNADGYDVDGVGASYLVVGEEREETAWASGDRFVEQGNWATYVEYTLSD